MQKRSSITAGLIMITVGVIFLLINLFPEFASQLDIARQWPLLIVAVGGFFLLGALFGTPDLATPGSIIAGIGGILYYQNLTGNWASWAFVWTLIPGFAGVGIVLSALMGRRGRGQLREGSRLIGISLILFFIFAAFFNGLGNIGNYWPVLLIAAGVWMLFRNRLTRR